MQNSNNPGALLHSIRKDRLLLQTDFLKYGITQSKISKIENELEDISLLDYNYLLDILKIQRNEFESLASSQSFTVQELLRNSFLYIISEKNYFLKNFMYRFTELDDRSPSYDFWQSMYSHIVENKMDYSLKEKLVKVENYYIDDFLLMLLWLPHFNKDELIQVFEVLKKSLFRNSDFYDKNNIVKSVFFRMGYLMCLFDLQIQATWIMRYFESFHESNIFLLNLWTIFKLEYYKKFSSEDLNLNVNRISEIESQIQIIQGIINE